MLNTELILRISSIIQAMLVLYGIALHAMPNIRHKACFMPIIYKMQMHELVDGRCILRGLIAPALAGRQIEP